MGNKVSKEESAAGVCVAGQRAGQTAQSSGERRKAA
jgi:hypothetical protein